MKRWFKLPVFGRLLKKLSPGLAKAASLALGGILLFMARKTTLFGQREIIVERECNEDVKEVPSHSALMRIVNETPVIHRTHDLKTLTNFLFGYEVSWRPLAYTTLQHNDDERGPHQLPAKMFKKKQTLTAVEITNGGRSSRVLVQNDKLRELVMCNLDKNEAEASLSVAQRSRVNAYYNLTMNQQIDETAIMAEYELLARREAAQALRNSPRFSFFA
jgi:hypothetical protein